jgi:hypothetical protein
MTSTLPQHHSISVSSFLTSNAVTLHHALTTSLRFTYASKYVNWLNFTPLIVLHRIIEATTQGQQRHLLRRELYRLSTAVTEVSVITRVLQSSYWTGESWMTAKMGFAFKLGGGRHNIIFPKTTPDRSLAYGAYTFQIRTVKWPATHCTFSAHLSRGTLIITLYYNVTR